jgi:hypothetical protein
MRTLPLVKCRFSTTLLLGLCASLRATPMGGTLLYPASNSTGVVTSPILRVRAEAGATPVNVTFYGRLASPAADFTLAVLPDSQYYSATMNGGTVGMFTAQTDWLVANRTSHNIAYVAHLGDIVNHGDTNAGPNNITQWRNATNALYRLENPTATQLPNGIPYGLAVGNHDQSPNGDPNGTTTYFNQYFGVNHFNGRPYYGGHYGTNNDNHFDLFSAGGMDFVALYLEYDPDANPAVLSWANSVLRAYPGRRALVVTHYFGSASTPSSFSAQGGANYTVLRTNANLFLMMSGHVGGEGMRSDAFAGHTAYTLVSDYQFRTNGGSGWMRLLEFSPTNNLIRVSTYTPYFNQYETDSGSQFTLSYAMSRATGDFGVLGSVTNVQPGAEATLLWAGLAPGSAYEWYAAVSDSTGSTNGPIWRFNTSGDAWPGQTNVIAAWDFNAPRTLPSGDSNPNTGTLQPFVGWGSLTNIGGTTNSFGSPPAGGATYTSDPWTGDNSGLRLGQFPAASSGNKTAGIECFASTAGFEKIRLTWDQENSASASKYWRLQYTTNGTTWTDADLITANAQATVTSSPDWQKQLSADLSTKPGVNNNPSFGFRLVSEFEQSATGAGSDAYVGNVSGTSYGTGGTLWLDMVTVSGTVLNNSNTPPTITSLPTQNLRANDSFGPLLFIVSDAETPAAALSLSASSSDPTLLRNFTFSGSGNTRTVSGTPEPNRSGSATVTINVTDAGGAWASTSFSVQVRAPALVVSNPVLRANSSAVVPIALTDYQSFRGNLSWSVQYTNAALLPTGAVSFTGSGGDWAATLTPAPGQVGVSEVTVTASDGGLSAATITFLKVVSSNTIALWDFNSKVRDYNEDTGDPRPGLGQGTNWACGSATATLNSHISADSFDPDLRDNSKWRFANFPTQGTSNRTSGAEFHVSTAGWRDIAMNWDHYNSATGSKYWRLQYSLDGIQFTDTSFVYTNPLETTFFQTGFSFAGIAGANNNPDFAVRLVSEFELTATGQGTNQYIATKDGSTYGTGGTLWLDTVTFSGAPMVRPVLNISRAGSTIQVSWPTNAGLGALQVTPGLTPPAWQTLPQPPSVRGSQYSVTLTNAPGASFFRLAQ